jgi:Cu(I)/Ag(I) efflux system protein CusF
MKQLLLTSLCAAAVAAPALAQTKPDDHAAHHAASAASASADMTVGEVRKVDKDTKKITIKHGEIKNLGMPPMTMVFQVKNPSWLDTYKTGDAIRFSAERTVTGAYLVTDIQPGK